ncbi:3'-5' exonuclease [Helicobacter bilis]|uniref:3'-5' exonuclease n=1 Tax=Helicobacter bilis TaxID=37372 RepID=UPI0026EEEBC4|nr:3'-5' exonuclease [Helicobacter bilis]MCI7410981.1 3'-5' exonuclease [Helicobacter bilis]MDD7296363.1 3'-5' exonuclease [Helicobacter bilis]MDY4400334.1 3'-5' exonuclease [Helicobacter bilis]
MALQYFGHYFNLLDQMPLSLESFHTQLSNVLPEYGTLECETLLEVMIGLHAPLYRVSDIESSDYIIDTTIKNINLNEAKLCFVDIETTSASVKNGQIIEIGAIIAQNGEILDTFDTLVYSPFVPEDIIDLTGIDSYMLEDAPRLEQVLKQFRAFLGDSVFVAHNVSFDYNFIAESLHEYDMPPLFNPRLCTLDLSRRTIVSKKYALAYLNDMLGINTAQAHRAYADALTAFRLYEICMQSLPKEVKTLQELIVFSKGKIAYPQRVAGK